MDGEGKGKVKLTLLRIPTTDRTCRQEQTDTKCTWTITLAGELAVLAHVCTVAFSVSQRVTVLLLARVGIYRAIACPPHFGEQHLSWRPARPHFDHKHPQTMPPPHYDFLIKVSPTAANHMYPGLK